MFLALAPGGIAEMALTGCSSDWWAASRIPNRANESEPASSVQTMIVYRMGAVTRLTRSGHKTALF
jgi:hypothetical protein